MITHTAAIADGETAAPAQRADEILETELRLRRLRDFT